MKRSREQLIARLEKEGLSFQSFTLSAEGRYCAEDAEWNYKDVPHLPIVHSRINAIIAAVDDDTIATINMQSTLGLRYPLALINYESSPHSQTYYTAFLFFVLIIETVYRDMDANKAKVDTTYSIGSPAYLKWCFPIIRWVLKKNYDYLMSGDIPMRERRGQLRDWGYSFQKGGERYSFERTMDISVANVVNPEASEPGAVWSVDIDRQLPEKGELLLGKDDHLGLRLVRSGTRLSVFPRLCPHEGASLDGQSCGNNIVRCPWHGRAFAPIAVFDVSKQEPQSLNASYHDMTLASGSLTITAKGALVAGARS